MKVLVVGSGGREHALAWRLRQDPSVDEVIVAPGNPGVESVGRRVSVAASDADELAALVRREGIGLTVVGPEAPLVSGLVDRLQSEDLVVFGPTQAAARLEGSKAFAKEFLFANGIPTAAGSAFDNAAAARAYVEERGAPIVIKADGLAAGKGAHVCATVHEALGAIDQIMDDRVHGDAGERIVVEECLQGEEASVFALAVDQDYIVLPTSQDHKRLADGDRGPMTGGMGAIAPAPVMTPAVLERVRRRIIEPTLAGMRERGSPYCGFLYVGLMVRDGQPRVLEYNCRLGDPEAQVVLPLVDGDFTRVLHEAGRGRLEPDALQVRLAHAACVVVAAPGYPEAPVKGLPIGGIDGDADASAEAIVFHAGTARNAAGELVTAGGRVLGVTASGGTLREALARAYDRIAGIQIEGAQFRRDIGHRALARAPEVEQV